MFQHLVCSPSMYDGFDEDPQVLSCLPGLVPFEADAEPRRSAVIEWHLKHELFLPDLRDKAWHAGHLILLGAGEKVMEAEVEKVTSMEKRGDRGQLIWYE